MMDILCKVKDSIPYSRQGEVQQALGADPLQSLRILGRAEKSDTYKELDPSTYFFNPDFLWDFLFS